MTAGCPPPSILPPASASSACGIFQLPPQIPTRLSMQCTLGPRCTEYSTDTVPFSELQAGKWFGTLFLGTHTESLNQPYHRARASSVHCHPENKAMTVAFLQPEFTHSPHRISASRPHAHGFLGCHGFVVGLPGPAFDLGACGCFMLCPVAVAPLLCRTRVLDTSLTHSRCGFAVVLK